MRIVYIDIDSLRPDHLGCYGYHRETSPNIDALSKESVRFTNYYTTDAPCLPSRTAFYTGRFGIHTGVVGHGGTAADMRIDGPKRNFRDTTELHSFPSFLQQNGYHTAQISPFGQRHAARQFYAGFNEIHNTGKGGMESAEEVSPVVFDWLDKNLENDNWYLHINYWDPHTPYRAPEEYGDPFENDPLPEWLTEDVLEEHRTLCGPHKAREITMFDNKTNPKFPRHPGELKDMSDLRKMIDGYDIGVKYVDDQLGVIFQKIKDAGLWDETAIIISADHGENLGELGIYGEHGTADNITCKVPLIIKWPGIEGGHVDEDLHYNIDFAPTVAELINRDPKAVWDGDSFAPVLTKKEACGRDQLVVSQCAHVCQRSVRFGPWLYTKTYHDGYHMFPSEMLYNVDEDPHETTDLAESNPELIREGNYRLSQWHEEMMNSMEHDTDPLWTVMKEGGPFHARGQRKKYCEYLKVSDREHYIPLLKERHPAEFE